MDFDQQLCNIVGESQIKRRESMKKHTTFRIGGPADYFVVPNTIEQTGQILQLCERESMPFYIIGNGSNLLVGDKGYRGLVLQLSAVCAGYSVAGNVISAGAGTRLSKLAGAAADQALSGLEFAAGIPGTLGGAIVMNAGAYQGEMKQVVRCVQVMDCEGNRLTLSNEELELGYRTSCIAAKGYLILEAELELAAGNRQIIRETMEDYSRQRKEKQPLEYPSAGSIFKRPEGYYAGQLIQNSGLAGFRIGGAMVSPKHCGFVVNHKDATAQDIMEICKAVQEKVFLKHGVMLEMEVKMLGTF